MSKKSEFTQLRDFLRDNARQQFDFSRTEQSRGIPPPPLQKPVPAGARRIALAEREAWTAFGETSLLDAMDRRRSEREFLPGQALSMNALSFLLWASQGVQETLHPAAIRRTVPSAGCRHAFETYLAVLQVGDLPQGIYRYLPLDHALIQLSTVTDLSEKLAHAALGQRFVGQGAVTFIWTVLPARMEWRYGGAAHKVLALDAGHVAQNLYLACTAIGAGTCAIGAYKQNAMDHLVEVDGEDEFVIYLAPVGMIHSDH